MTIQGALPRLLQLLEHPDASERCDVRLELGARQ
jgi:hypothetical protein